MYCPRPSRALLPKALSRPPMTAVGSRPARSSTSATMEVVVVLPCAPAMAMPDAQPHQLGQHLGAGNDGHVAGAGGDDLRVVGRHGRRHDDHVGIGDVGGRVADLDAHAERAQSVGRDRAANVRAADPIVEIHQQLGDAAHADAADADEVHVARAPEPHHAPAPESAVAIASSRIRARRTSARPRAWPPGEPGRPGAWTTVSARRAPDQVPFLEHHRRAGPTSTCAFLRWWSSVAAGNGTRTAGRPAAASSANVVAPARQTTRSAASTSTATRVEERLGTVPRPRPARIRPARRRGRARPSGARASRRCTRAAIDAAAADHGDVDRVRALGPAEHSTRALRFGRLRGRSAGAKNSARTGFPVTNAAAPKNGTVSS